MASGAQRRIKSISYAKYGYLFILPFFLVYFFFQLWPLINTFILSFKDFTGENSVGLANYKALFKGVGTEPMNFSDGSTFKIADRTARVVHENFLSAFKNTVILWIGNFIPQIALSLSLAVWFTDAQLKIPGKGFFKIVMYLPNIITAASVAVLFLQLCGEAENVPGSLKYLPNIITAVSVAALFMRFISNSQLSAVNTLLLNAGNDAVSFEASAVWSRGIVMFIQTWLWFGNTMIMLMSGIQGINPSLFEAASIDGATSGQVFRKITFPLLSPIMAYTLVTSMIGGLQMFDIPYLYHKDPNHTSENLKTVAVYIYEYFYDQTDPKLGFAGTASVLLFLVTLILGCIAFYLTRDKDAIAKKKQRKKIAKQNKRESKQFGGFTI